MTLWITPGVSDMSVSDTVIILLPKSIDFPLCVLYTFSMNINENDILHILCDAGVTYLSDGINATQRIVSRLTLDNPAPSTKPRDPDMDKLFMLCGVQVRDEIRNRRKISAIKYLRDNFEHHFGRRPSLVSCKNAVDAYTEAFNL